MTTRTLRGWLREHALAVSVAAVAAVLLVIFHAELVAWFTGAGDGDGSRSETARTQSGEITVDAAIEPDPPHQGKNTLVVTLTRGGAPVSGADVDVQVWMPAMGSMPEMRSVAEVTEPEPGVYRARFDLSMGGSWTATVEAAGDEETITAEYGLTVGTEGLRPIGSSAGANKAPPAAPPTEHVFTAEARAKILAALDAYEAIRAALANDSLAGIGKAGELVAAAARAAQEADEATPVPLVEHLESAAAAAEALADAPDVNAARVRFSEVSEHVVAVVSADPALQRGRFLFECPMWESYSRWIQPTDELANPYMGQSMPTCGSGQPWVAAAEPSMDHVHDPDDVAHYTCSMHPWVKEDSPDDTCPVCSMDLTPVTHAEITEGVVRVDRERRQAFGVRTATVERRQLTVPIRAVGRVAYDERRLHDVTLKYKGWIERLFVEETGEKVRKGQPLFAVYSPELFAAQHELILAAAQVDKARTDVQRSRAEALLRGARMRMRLWDLGDAQIDAVIDAGKPLQRITVRSPASGYVIEKDVVEGAAVEPGTRLFRIADLDRIWVEAEVYEQDLGLVAKGQAATVRLSHVPGATYAGTVSFIHPTLDPETRAARVRVELKNAGGELKPDMFAEVDLLVDQGIVLAVPEPAIVYSGPRRIVFVDIGDDRLRPTVVEVGAVAGGWVEVLSGLREGDRVVVSGNFLIAAESRLKSATGIW